MRHEYGVLLDRKIVENQCRAFLQRNKKNTFHDFFSYLREHPFLGIVTNRTKHHIQDKYWGSKQKRSDKCRQVIYEFDEMLENFLRLESVEYSNFQENLKQVNNVFNTLVEPTKPPPMPDKYRALINDFVKSQYSRFELRERDKKDLAEAVCLKPRYKQLFFTSSNKMLSHPFILNAVEEKLDFICGDIALILSELQKLTFI